MDLGRSIRRNRKARAKGAARVKGGAGTRGARRAGKSKRARRPAGPRSRRRRAGRLSRHPALAALLVAGTGLGVGYLIAVALIFPANEQTLELQAVPDVRGEPLALALAMVVDSGLVVGHVDSVRHPRVAAGLVLGQSPLPGLTARSRAPVRITVSSGPEMRAVPDLTRLDGDRAAELLNAGGFVVRVDTADSRTPAGRVLGIDPAPGTEIRIPGDVLLLVSRGPPTFPMPQLAGMTQGEAYAVLRSLGLELGEVDRRYSLLNVRVVFGQDPEPHVPVAEGTPVRLFVGREVRLARLVPEAMEPPDPNGGNHEPLTVPGR